MQNSAPLIWNDSLMTGVPEIAAQCEQIARRIIETVNGCRPGCRPMMHHS